MTAQPPSNQTMVWRQLDAEHHVHPFTDHADLARKGVRVVTAAEGVYLWDSEGNKLLDGMAGLWCANIGYGRKELAQAAARQMAELPFYNTFFQSTHPPAVELAQKLAEITPAGLGHAFFANSGSEANDSIVKMVRYFWNLEGKHRKKVIISRERAYHGVTLAAASLSGLSAMHPQADLPLPLFEHVMAPYWYDEGGEMSAHEFGLKAARALEERILEIGSGGVAAFIGEPIMGAGGVIVPPESYWPEIQRICRQYDVLLIADEVICGFGRTGRWFGSERYGIEPDFMTLAKGLSSGYLPISAVMIGQRVAEAMIGANEEFVHGFTYSGHPVACAVALANIRILEDEGIVERVGADTGPYFQARLRELADHALVGEVRGTGMIAAVELVADKDLRRHFEAERQVGILCRDHSIDEGLVMRAVQDIMVLAPPLVISRAEIDELVDKMRLAFDLTARDLGL